MIKIRYDKKIEKKLLDELNLLKKNLNSSRQKRYIFFKKNQKKERDNYTTLKQILALKGEDFIFAAYQKILNRPPDISGLNFYLSKLYSGEFRKSEILARLKLSPEGRLKKSKIKGLWIAIIIFILYRMPLLGFGFQFLGFILGLPSFLAKIRSMDELNYKFQKEVYLKHQEVEHNILDMGQNLKQVEHKVLDMENDLKQLKQKVLETCEVEPIWEEKLFEQIKAGENRGDFYTDFEEAFRGTIEDIKKRQLFYVKLLKEFFEQDKELTKFHILDIGCGRGEFLELCQENNLKAIGVELREDAAFKLVKRGFRVYAEDGISFLKNSKDSFAAICAFQVIEHLNWETLKELVLEAKEKLTPGGVLILETINPWNIEAVARFYLDYTHKLPVVPELLCFLLKWAGFKEARLYYFSPLKSKRKIEEGVKRLYLDYAVVARR